MRLSEARLHAVSSRNMYSEQGLLALILAEFGQVCQSLMVVSNCMPGSPHCQAASAMCFIRSRAFMVSQGWPEIDELRLPIAVFDHSPHELVRDPAPSGWRSGRTPSRRHRRER